MVDLDLNLNLMQAAASQEHGKGLLGEEAQVGVCGGQPAALGMNKSNDRVFSRSKHGHNPQAGAQKGETLDDRFRGGWIGGAENQ